MRLYLQTRGRTADYAFVGEAPANRWWLDFGEFTSFEAPTVLVVADGARWRCFISGVPSARRDRVGTPIRYTVVAAGATADAAKGVVGMVRTWTEDVGTDTLAGEVRSTLDSALSEEDVERLLVERGQATSDDVRRRLDDVLSRFEGVGGDRSGPPGDGSWVGAVSAARSRSRFVSRVSGLVNGTESGIAALLNLAQADEARLLAERHPHAAVLVSDPDGLLGSEPVPIEKKKTTSRDTPDEKPLQWRAIALLILAITAILLLIWLLPNKP